MIQPLSLLLGHAAQRAHGRRGGGGSLRARAAAAGEARHLALHAAVRTRAACVCGGACGLQRAGLAHPVCSVRLSLSPAGGVAGVRLSDTPLPSRRRTLRSLDLWTAAAALLLVAADVGSLRELRAHALSSLGNTAGRVKTRNPGVAVVRFAPCAEVMVDRALQLTLFFVEFDEADTLRLDVTDSVLDRALAAAEEDVWAVQRRRPNALSCLFHLTLLDALACSGAACSPASRAVGIRRRLMDQAV